MTLFMVLLNLNQFPEQDSLYVQRPWTLESETLVNAIAQSTAICRKTICTAIFYRSRPSNNTSNILNPKISAYKTAVSASLNLRYKHLSKSFLWRQLTLTWASATLFTHSNHLSNKSVALTILISINLYRPFTYLQQIDYFANYRTMP